MGHGAPPSPSSLAPCCCPSLLPSAFRLSSTYPPSSLLPPPSSLLPPPSSLLPPPSSLLPPPSSPPAAVSLRRRGQGGLASHHKTLSISSLLLALPSCLPFPLACPSLLLALPSCLLRPAYPLGVWQIQTTEMF